MSGYYPKGGSMSHGRIVDPNADQGSDKGWATAASARSSQGVARSNQMPPDIEPLAKNEFGSGVLDGNVSQTDLDCGYHFHDLDPLEPLYTGEPSTKISKLRREKLDAKMDFHETNEGFVERNNYMDRN